MSDLINDRDTQFESSLLSIGFFFFLSYTSLVGLTVSIFGDAWGNNSHPFFPAYYLVVVSGLSLFSFKDFQQEPRFHAKKQTLFFLTIIAIAFSLSTAWLMKSQLLWQDEYTQFIRSAIPARRFFESLIDFSTNQQQPPADYYFSYFSSMIFGVTPLAIRFHSTLFAFGFYLGLFLLLVVHTRSRLISLALTFYALSFPSLRYYLIDARPIALALFVSIFVLHYFLLSLQNHQKSSVRFFLTSAISLTLTIGFQTEIFLLVLGFVLVVVAILDEERRYRCLKIFGSLVFAAFVFLPFLYLIYVYGEDQEQFLVLTINERLMKVLGSRAVLGSHFIQDFAETTWRFPALILVGLTVGSFVLGFKKVFSERMPLAISFLLFLLFPAFFTIIYDVLINWNYSVRYNLIYCGPFFLFVAALSAYACEGRFQKSNLVAVLVVLFGLTVHNLSTAQAVIKQHNGWKANWPAAYAALEAELRKDSSGQGLFLKLFETGESSGPNFPLHELYLSAESQSQLLLDCKRKECEYFVGQALSTKAKKTFYILFDSLNRGSVYHKVLSQSLPVLYDGNRAKLYRIDPGSQNQWIKNIEELLETKPYINHPVFLSKVLISYYCHRGDSGESLQRLRELLLLKNGKTVNNVGQAIEVDRYMRRHLRALRHYSENQKTCEYLIPELNSVTN